MEKPALGAEWLHNVKSGRFLLWIYLLLQYTRFKRLFIPARSYIGRQHNIMVTCLKLIAAAKLVLFSLFNWQKMPWPKSDDMAWQQAIIWSCEHYVSAGLYLPTCSKSVCSVAITKPWIAQVRRNIHLQWIQNLFHVTAMHTWKCHQRQLLKIHLCFFGVGMDSWSQQSQRPTLNCVISETNTYGNIPCWKVEKINHPDSCNPESNSWKNTNRILPCIVISHIECVNPSKAPCFL